MSIIIVLFLLQLKVKYELNEDKGSMLAVLLACRDTDCTYSTVWKSQPALGGKSRGNFLLSSCIFLTRVPLYELLLYRMVQKNYNPAENMFRLSAVKSHVATQIRFKFMTD